MKCHYEVLNVPREASSADIKTAYRKQALLWHPDKNLDNLQEAKEQFQLVQNAYEVLYDPQERAWYDSHREQLLRGAGSSYNDDSFDVFPYFSPSCYKGFGDDGQGFYAVYSEVFSKLAAEETDFLDDPEDLANIPKFGKSTTPYEEVHEFYGYWMSFSTNKSFVWLDQYTIQQGDNRRIIKLMEKENNKIRQKARRERNEEIRRLVSFVRRKDKRVIEHTKLLQEKAEENKKKAELLRRDRIIKRQKEIEEAKKKQGETSFIQSEEYQQKLSEIESLLQEEFGITSDDDTISEGGMESSNEDSSRTGEASENSKATPKTQKVKQSSVKNLYCSACNKLFKNIKSFENHENSKKHKENVANMSLDEDIGLSDDSVSSVEENVNGKTEEKLEEAEAEVEELAEELAEHLLNPEVKESDVTDDIKESLSESDQLEAMTKSQKKKIKKKKQFAPPPESEGNDSHDEMSFNEIEAPSRSRRAKKFTMLKNQIQAKKETEKKGSTSQTSTEKEIEMDNVTDIVGEEAKIIRNIRLNKPKKIEKKSMKRDDEKEVVTCAVCKADFISKNKLFDHLKKTGHSVPLTQSINKKGKKGNR